MRLSLPPSGRKDLLQYVQPMLSNIFGDARIRTDWKICTKQSGIWTSSSQRRKNKARKPLLYRMRLLIVLLLPLTSYGQVLVDTNTIKQANTYLVKGAIAREKVAHLQKIVTSDSIIIAEQDSIITKQKTNIAYLNQENNDLVKRNKAITRTLILFKRISIGLTILTLLSWLK
jgi:hypothetical protein